MGKLWPACLKIFDFDGDFFGDNVVTDGLFFHSFRFLHLKELVPGPPRFHEQQQDSADKGNRTDSRSSDLADGS